MEKYLNQLQSFLKVLTVRQRVLLGVTAGAVALTLWIFVRLFASPDIKPLYTGLSPSDAQGVAERLASQNIAYKISSDGGSVLVPADKLDQLRLEMSEEGPPQSGRIGFELFDKPNWSGSDFSEQVDYQRALEGELERTIDTIDDVEAARVHIVMPHESLFTDQERKSKAAVVLRLRGGARLPSAEVTGIARLVASAVDNLSPEQVTIVDADTGAPLQALPADGSIGSFSTMDTALTRKLIDTLTPIVGEGHVKASVTVQRDPTSGESTQEIYDPNGSVVLTSQISEEQGGGALPTGVPGTASNVPRASGANAAAASATTSSNSQTLRNEEKTFAVSKTIRHLLEPAGRVKRMSVALLVDDAVDVKDVNGKKEVTRQKRTPEEMKEIQDVAMAAVGFDASRGDQIEVQNFPFQTLPVEQPAAPTVFERVRTFTEDWIVVLRYAGLLLLFAIVYFMLLRPVQKQLLASFREVAERVAPGKDAVLSAGRAAMSPAVAGDLEEIPMGLEQEANDAASDVKRVVVLKRDLVEKVKKDPSASGRLVQNWIRQKQAAR